MVLPHLLSTRNRVHEGSQFELVECDLYGFGEEVLETAHRPAQRQFALVQQTSFLVFDDDVYHACAFLDLVHLHLLLDDGLDFLFFCIGGELLSTS